jgi:sugar lactone lactonase YvrE
MVLALSMTPARVHAQTYTFTTLAGAASGHRDGAGGAARFDSPVAVATDDAGNIYVVDSANDAIRKIAPDGLTSTFAGGSRGNRDGVGSDAQFNDPRGIATDSSGNVYVSDSGNQTIRKITPAGLVTTLAGAGGLGDYADGTGMDAVFDRPLGLAVDRDGNIFVADATNCVIRRVTQAGVVTTVAGTPHLGGTSDGIGSAARFRNPSALAFDDANDLYIADTGNNSIRKMAPDGFVSTLAGGQHYGSQDGAGSLAQFNTPLGVAADRSGNVYVADEGNHEIRRISPMGVVTTFAGNPAPGKTDASGSAASFNDPSGIVMGSSGDLYVADTFNSAIREITPGGLVTTVAGMARGVKSEDGTPADARFAVPVGLAAGANGDLYVTDLGAIRRITPAGLVTTITGAPTGSAIAVDGAGNLFIGSNRTIQKITPSGDVTSLAGMPGVYGGMDGIGSAASLDEPRAMTIDAAGNIVFTDGCAVRRLAPNGEVTTLAGVVLSCGTNDGIGSAARFSSPLGIVTDSQGSIYVGDSCSIRKISPERMVTTVAGGQCGNRDGAGLDSRLGVSLGLALDHDGNLFVADSQNNDIRLLRNDGTVSTVAGGPVDWALTDGTGSAAAFAGPSAIVIGADGRLYVADTGNRAIRIGVPAIADSATIDAYAGDVAVSRRLDTSANTATSWQWSVIQRPGGAAPLSNASSRNPTFSPDVPGLYVFQLLAANGAGARVSTIRLKAPAQSDVSPHLSVTIAGDFFVFPFGSGAPAPDSGSFTLTVSNSGVAATTGTVSVRVALSTNLLPLTMGGPGWDCNVAGLICSRTDSLLPTARYPDIAVTARELGGRPINATVAVSGGGAANPAKAVASLVLNSTSLIGCDPLPPSGGPARLDVSQTLSGNLIRGQRESSYLVIQVDNAGTGRTSGPVTITDQLPPDLVATAISGDGWSCDLASLTCTRHDLLAAFNGCTLPSYPPITIAIDVAQTAPDTVVNLVFVSNGGSKMMNGSSTTLTIGQPGRTRRRVASNREGGWSPSFSSFLARSRISGRIHGAEKLDESLH